MPPQTMRQFLKPPEKAPDTLPRTQSTMSLLDYFSTVIQGLADPTGWTEPKAEDFDNPHAYTQALRAHGVGQLLGMAAPLAAPLGVLTRARTAEAAVEAPQTLKAFHGSPHDFPAERLIQLPGGQQAYQLASEALPQGASVVKELPLGRFRGDKIGTGEGGQAYSYGHYAAQNPGVSETYKRPGMHSHIIPTTIDDIPLGQYRGRVKSETEKLAVSALEKNPTIDEAVKYLQQDRGTEASQQWLKDNASRIKDASKTGKMYELNLHTSPESLLDWDKPLSQQPKKVIDWLRQSDAPFGYKAKSKNWRGSGALPDDVWLKSLENTTGEELYQALVTPMGRAGHTEGIASQQLADAGIHGVQYLDQGSRNLGDPAVLRQNIADAERYLADWKAAEPHPNRTIQIERMQGTIKQLRDTLAKVESTPETRNYVIFPHFEHLIEISKKYGISLPAAASLYKWQQSQQQKGVE